MVSKEAQSNTLQLDELYKKLAENLCLSSILSTHCSDFYFILQQKLKKGTYYVTLWWYQRNGVCWILFSNWVTDRIATRDAFKLDLPKRIPYLLLYLFFLPYLQCHVKQVKVKHPILSYLPRYGVHHTMYPLKGPAGIEIKLAKCPLFLLKRCFGCHIIIVMMTRCVRNEWQP